MESDAFSSYVAVDMELQKPLFEVGIISGTLYADVDDESAPAADAPAARPHRFRHSLEVLKRAVGNPALWRRLSMPPMADNGPRGGARSCRAR